MIEVDEPVENPTTSATPTIGKPTWKEQGYLPARYIVTVLAFFGMICNYMLRINLNLTIVAMVKLLNSTEENSKLDPCEFGFDVEMSGYKGKLEWTAFTQSLVIGSFFWGYIWTQIPGGRLADRIGAKRVFGSAIFVSSLLSLLLPLSTKGGAIPVMCVRFLMGFAQGPSFPSTHALLASWAPPLERSVMSAYIYAGPLAGTIITFPFCAAIIASIGWEAVFYIQAGITIVWVCLWFLLVSDGPEDFRWISDAEKNYIISSLGNSKSKKARAIPFKSIFTSMPFWAIIVVAFGANWGFYTLITDLPLYMKNVLHKNIKANALLSGLPFLGQMVFSLFFSAVGDKMRRKGIVSTVILRKTATALAQCGPAICLFSLSLIRCNQNGAIGILFAAVILQGAMHAGALINHIDIAPNLAGTLGGISNALASIAAWIAPLVAGALTTNNHTFEQWEKVFYIVATIFVADSIFYCIFASGELQPWNDVADGSVKEEPIKEGTEAIRKTSTFTEDDLIVNRWSNI